MSHISNLENKSSAELILWLFKTIESMRSNVTPVLWHPFRRNLEGIITTRLVGRASNYTVRLANFFQTGQSQISNYESSSSPPKLLSSAFKMEEAMECFIYITLLLWLLWLFPHHKWLNLSVLINLSVN